jgi:hypothetical protein
VYNFRDLAGGQLLFAQLWKEYSYSDSRYLTQDPFVLCMETITAVRSSRNARLPSTDRCAGILGSLGFPYRLHDRDRTPAPLSPPTHRVTWPNVRRRVVLRNEHVRPLHERDIILEARGLLLLGLLHRNERALDCHTRLLDME